MMAEAIIAGLIGAGVNKDDISASDVAESRREYLSQTYGITALQENRTIAMQSDIVIIAVKPDVVPSVLKDISGCLDPAKLLVSIAAGITTSDIESELPEGVPVIRVMPNAPALIRMGASGVAKGQNASEDHIAIALEIFSVIGKAVEVPESKMDAVTGLSGSGPAYVYLIIDALADGGVRMGLSRATALLLAAQTVAGAAAMVLETGNHPSVLKDQVATPGGTTIEGLVALEEGSVRNAFIQAVTAASQKSSELAKKDGH